MNHSAAPIQEKLFSDAEIAEYRRDGYVVARGILGPHSIEICRQALADLASGRIAPRQTVRSYETGYREQDLSPDERELHIRKFMDYLEDAPALNIAAMNRRLHLLMDQLVGAGRVLFQEMALIKPPHIGSEKPWHQDAAYFRVSDPSLIVGTWIALDPALRSNGCMEVVPGSHHLGPAPHEHADDLNLCNIHAGRVDPGRRVAIEMQPGDVLIFHSLLHHYTAPNSSPLRRRALQFHYHQIGMEWTSLEAHQRLFHDTAGAYAGCTVPHAPQRNYSYRPGLIRRIEPIDPPD
jgi:phytanoyl-CoA hydroxylase